MVLFTDGITEAAKADGEEFGEERVLQLIRSRVEQSPNSLKDQLLADVKTFCDFKLHDDATLIVLGALARPA